MGRQCEAVEKKIEHVFCCIHHRLRLCCNLKDLDAMWPSTPVDITLIHWQGMAQIILFAEGSKYDGRVHSVSQPQLCRHSEWWWSVMSLSFLTNAEGWWRNWTRSVVTLHCGRRMSEVGCTGPWNWSKRPENCLARLRCSVFYYYLNI